MACRLDVKKAILKSVTDKFVKGRNTYELLTDEIISIVNVRANPNTKARKDSQAEAIANNLAKRISDYTNGHVYGWVNRTSQYVPYTVTLNVSDRYIDEEYDKLPADRKTDPRDKQIPKEYQDILAANKDKLDSLNKMMLAGDPQEFLKFVALQSYGIAEDGTDLSLPEDLKTSLFEKIPKPIIEVAQATFPRESFIKPDNLPAIEC